MDYHDLVRDIPIPRLFKVRQIFEDSSINDIPQAVERALERPQTLEKIQPGMHVAVAAGSRGITDYVQIVRAICDMVKRRGGLPFIVPSMGSHGGSTAQGQLEVLSSQNITQDSMGCPIISSMDTVEVGRSPDGVSVFMDKHAAEADAAILVNRIKPHPAFVHRIESGLCKMAVIGLGKQKGADYCHRTEIHKLGPLIEEAAGVIFKNANVAFGVGIIEDAYEHTKSIAAIPAESLLSEEPALLEEAKRSLPQILLPEYDVLVMDEMGKNISGSGFDNKVVGRFPNPMVQDTAVFERMVILRLTEQSHGNAMGISNADTCPQVLVDAMDKNQMYPNALTALAPFAVKIPMTFKNDEYAIKGAIKLCPDIQPQNARLVRILNTANLGEIYLSENLLETAKNHPAMEIISEVFPFPFDGLGNVCPF